MRPATLVMVLLAAAAALPPLASAQQPVFGQQPLFVAPPTWAQPPAAIPAVTIPDIAVANTAAPDMAGSNTSPLPPPPGATAASRAAARALGDVIGIEAQVDAALARIHRDLLQRVIGRTGKDVDTAVPIVDRLLMPGFTDRRAELRTLLLEPWARNFTAGDLRLLRGFLASPLGRRYLALRPTLASEANAAAGEWMKRVFRDTTERKSLELEAIGLRF